MSSLIVEVCKVDKLEKHPNADRLLIATVKGWNCIVGLNDFKEGDLVVFYPPDCIMPENMIEQYNLEYLKKGGRVRTTKLRGYISQGLVLPIPTNCHSWKEGLNVATILGIKKYEPPEPYYQGQPRETLKSVFHKYREGRITTRRFIRKSLGIVKDTFRKKKNVNPLFTKYTDMENIKNFHTIFQTNNEVVITEKIHGTNFRSGYLKRPTKYFWQRWILKMLGEYEFVYGSHNVQITGHRGRRCFYGEDIYGQIAKRYNLAEIIPKDYIIYGEIYGKKIQKLEYGLDSTDVVFFDVKYKDKYLSYVEFTKFCKDRNLPTVPVFYIGKLDVSALKEYTIGLSILCTSQIREGCVIKALTEEYHPKIGRKILKSINPEYLAKQDRTDFH